MEKDAEDLEGEQPESRIAQDGQNVITIKVLPAIWLGGRLQDVKSCDSTANGGDQSLDNWQ